MVYTVQKISKKNNKFGPTSVGHFYQPLWYHNASAASNPFKHKWCIKQNEQYEVFKIADEGYWFDVETKGLVSIKDNGKKVLGEKGERLAFFPQPSNIIDPWHGYPIDSSYISDSIADKLFEMNVIDKITHRRLLRKAL